MFATLLSRPDVTEELELRSRFGFMAFHGGELEKTTDTIAREAAAACDASYYGVLQQDEPLEHVPSTRFDPAHSALMQKFFANVDVVATIHGYGREGFRYSVLLGGRHRRLAAHMASHLRPVLPDYDFCDDLELIPRPLRGQHRANPVNIAAGSGVQIELPATIRWNWEERGWSDHDDIGRAPQVDTLIRGLATAVRAWDVPI